MVQTATKKNALSSKDGLPLANIGSIIKIQFRFKVLLTLDAVIFKIEIIIDSEYNNNRGAKPTKIALIVQVNVYRLLMVRDINNSVRK